MRQLGAVEREIAVRLGARVLGTHALEVEPLAGGFANATLRVSRADGARIIVRIFLRNPAVAGIEMAVLARAAGAVPVPRVLECDARGEIGGRPALALEFVEGTTLDRILQTTPGAAREIAPLLGAALARLETIYLELGGFFNGPELHVERWKASPSATLRAHLDQTLASVPVQALDPDLVQRWRALVERSAPEIDATAGARSLVHADFNPKNLLVRERDGRWELAAILDWEFAFSGSTLFDVGNLLRFEHALPTGFAAAFHAGLVNAGGNLPERWRELAATLDVFSLCDFLRRGPQGPHFAEIVDLVRRAVLAGSLAPRG